MELEQVFPIEKRTPEGILIYDDEVKVKSERASLLQLYEFPYFGKPE